MVQQQKRLLESDAGYQRRKALGHDGRMREAIEHQAKCIHERDKMGGSGATYEQALRRAQANAERVDRKRND